MRSGFLISEFLWIVMWTPSCARCCWRRRSSINRRRVRVHGPPPNGCRQHAEAAAARKLRAAPICPLCARRQLQLASSCCPSPDIQGAVLRAAARRAAARRAATPHAATRCAAAAAGCRVLRPCGGRAHRSSASPAAPLLAARSGCQRRVRPCTTPIRRHQAGSARGFVYEVRFCVRFAEFRIQCHILVCKD